MANKKYLGEILLFFILALYEEGVNGKTFRIALRNPEDIQSFQTPGYPEFVPLLTTITWKLHAPRHFRLDLDCPEIILKYRWKGGVRIKDGSERIDYSASKSLWRLSEGRDMTLELWTGLSSARMSCSVRPIRSEVGVLEEPDSRELGFGTQQKSTSCPCGWTNKKRIIGGRKTDPNEFVFMAYLRRFEAKYEDLTYNLSCTASILTQRHVLTATHCLRTFPKEVFDVVVGGHHLLEDSKNGTVQTIKIHEIHPYEPFKDDTNLQDIAILELTEDIQFTQFVGPVCIPSESYNLTNQWVKALGWGFRTPVGPVGRTLRTVNLEVFDMKDCIKYHEYINRTETVLCFLTPNRDICHGDSGGPLLYYDPEIDRYVQVAVISSSGVDCLNGYPVIGINVFVYLEWINEVISRESSGLPKKNICQKV